MSCKLQQKYVISVTVSDLLTRVVFIFIQLTAYGDWINLLTYII